jgi:hypothetical protein
VMSWAWCRALLRTASGLGLFIHRSEDTFAGSTDMLVWDCVIPGKKDTIWDTAYLPLTLRFSEEYPEKPPTAHFPAGFFHPNVYPSGKVCLVRGGAPGLGRAHPQVARATRKRSIRVRGRPKAHHTRHGADVSDTSSSCTPAREATVVRPSCVERKGGWTCESEVSEPSIRRISSMCGGAGVDVWFRAS